MKLDCVYYAVSDLERATGFYAGTLGLALESRDVVARFRVDGLLLELVPGLERGSGAATGNARVTFEVPDLAQAVADLRGRGVAVRQAEAVANGALAVFEDPDGNELVLWQYGSHRRAAAREAAPPAGDAGRAADAREPGRGSLEELPVTFSSALPDPRAYHELFETTGWNEEYRATPADLERANRGSWFTVAAYRGERLVAFGRIVSDGVLHAMVYDLIVRPEDQRSGLGSQVLARLVARCREAGIADVQLFCARGKQGFYLRHGFEPRPDDAPGMQLRRDA